MVIGEGARNAGLMILLCLASEFALRFLNLNHSLDSKKMLISVVNYLNFSKLIYRSEGLVLVAQLIFVTRWSSERNSARISGFLVFRFASLIWHFCQLYVC